MYVSLTEDDFIDDKALYCFRNFTYNGTNYVHLVKCIQPVRGQYVTMANHVYADTDISVDNPNYDLFSFTNCLMICEFEVYVEKGKLTDY